MKIEIKDSQGHVIQSADLPDGQYTLTVSGAKLESAKIQGASLRTIFLAGVTVALALFNQYLIRSHMNAEIAETLRSSLEALTGIIVAILLLSLVARALTHKFQIWECASFIFMGFIGYAIWGMNLFGFRWTLPRIFWIREVYVLLVVAWLCFMGSYLIRILAAQLSSRWRHALVSAFAFIVIVYNLLNFLPFRREYQFYRIDTPPPRPAAFESSPVSIEDFLSSIRE